MTRNNDGLENFKEFSKSKTLPELEKILEDARINFFTCYVRQETPEMTTKYLNAHKLASDTYYARKWSQ